MGYKVPMAIMRGEAQRIFPDTVVVTAPTATQTDRGGQKVAYDPLNAVTYTNCLLSPAGKGQYQMFADRVTPGTLFTLRFAHDVTLGPLSKIVINGSEYQLMTPSPEASYDVSETFMVTLKV